MKKFRQMKPKAHSVSFFAVDTNADHQVIGKAVYGLKGFHDIIMYPAFHKDPKEVPRLGSWEGDYHFVEFIQKNADVKFQIDEKQFTKPPPPKPQGEKKEAEESEEGDGKTKKKRMKVAKGKKDKKEKKSWQEDDMEDPDDEADVAS